MCLWHVPVVAETLSGGDLEKLFEVEHYQEFFEAAQPMAQQGNANALFLLGKAYHLGKGVDPDPEQARYFYEMAAEQNSAKAENNLGTMENQDNNLEMALKHYNRALELGLKLPTLNNIGVVRMKQCQNRFRHEDGKPCIQAGDSFLQAWSVSHNNSALDEAVVAYVSACIVNRQFTRFTKRDQEIDPLTSVVGCKQAIEWAEKGAELGLPRATYNRGAIEYYTERYSEALPWFYRANELGLGLAAYTLGDMYEKGLGVPKNVESALGWFKRGAELKDEQATRRMRSYWTEKMSSSYDLRLIEEAMAEWGKLTPPQAYPPEGPYSLELIKTIAANKITSPGLAKAHMPKRFCPQDEMLYENTYWALFAVTKPEDASGVAESLPLLAKGMIDANGCALLTGKVRATLQKALASGATLMFNWPGRRYLISIAHASDRLLEFKLGLRISY